MQTSSIGAPATSYLPPAHDPAPLEPPAAPSTDPAPEPRRARGVLRNLAAGHFRGVADARLQQNFAEEIKGAGLNLPAPTAPSSQGKAFAKIAAGVRPSVDTVA